MKLWYQKSYYILRSVLAVLLISVVLFTSSINGYCESVSPTPPIINRYITTVVDYLDYCYEATAQEFVKLWTIIDPRNSLFSYDQFKQWLHDREKDSLLDEEVVIHTHGGGGHSRVSTAVDDSTDIEVPQELKTEINLFIENQIEQNPLGYRACYIPSYSTMTATPYPTYKMYNAVKQYIKDHSGYSFFVTWDINYGNVSACHVFTLARDLDIGWVGSTTSAGTFTNVHPYINWELLTSSNLNNFVTSKVKISANGDLLTTNAGISNNVSFSNANTLVATGSPQTYMVYTSYNNRELVYVFETLNAYKNYNSGIPQPYYLTQTGMNGDHPINNGIINSGTLNQSTTYYNSVVDNSKTGMTPEEVMELIKLILDGKIGPVNGSDDDDDDDDSSIWDTIAKGVKALVSGVAKVIQGLIDGILNAILGEEDENGERHGGLLGSITSLINSVLTFFTDTNGTVFLFLSAFIGWLPVDIVNVLKSLFVIAVMFALIKLVREAF